ncbi:hypothetical protein ACWEWY_33450, partial [Streptomyces sp. NPDC003863]
RTGLWESHRNRPERYAKQRPRRTPYRSLDQYHRARWGASVHPGQGQTPGGTRDGRPEPRVRT